MRRKRSFRRTRKVIRGLRRSPRRRQSSRGRRKGYRRMQAGRMIRRSRLRQRGHKQLPHWKPPLSVPQASGAWRHAAQDAGRRHGDEYAALGGQDTCKDIVRFMQTRFTEFLAPYRLEPLSYSEVRELAKAYRAGFTTGRYQNGREAVLIPTTRPIDAIVCAQNEEDSIAGVLKELGRLPLSHTIVVVNGSSDGSLQAVLEASEDASIVHYPEALGHDVGRAIGASLSQAEILLFADADIPIAAEELGAYIWACDNGVDVALNDISPFLGPFFKRDGITHCKEWLNRSLGRADLHANSLTAVPHAITRRALDTVGVQNLIVPPKFQTLALSRGLRTEAVHAVDVIGRNRIRRTNVGASNPVAELIIGDHVEAFHSLWEENASFFSEKHQREQIAERRNRG
ncbi:glycosyltransferase family 2 protein [Paenibacillus thiaminolyticus]|uniref:glycosyltransferase family 2 protein n=1 Tax=Paenibacillus thiaminolyticus TaxID=49283 RepID=UPI001F0D1079|nr:glycosyltransferase [Paenibacillus thiaminolyticus]